MDFRPNDAALKAAQFDKSALPVAQPVGAPVVTATHVQPSSEPVVAVQAVQAVAVPCDGRQGPAGSWHDGLCDCFNDCGTCCCATCCPLVMIAQLRQLVLGGSCVSTAAFLFVTIYGGGTMRVLGSILAEGGQRPEPHHHDLRHGKDMYDYDDSDEDAVEFTGALAFAMVVSCVGGLMQLLGAVLALIWTVSGRTAMRVKEGIRPDTCGEAEDCLLGLCCQCCTLSQMMRHVLNRWGTRGGAPYELCSPTGSASVSV